jgi:hypothetical protein
VNAKEALEAVRAAEAAAPRGPCDWCRQTEDTDAHRLVCREHLAWVLHPDEDVHRDYWMIVGDFHKLHLTRVLGVMRRNARADRWLHTSRNDAEVVTVAVAKRGRDGGLAYENVGRLNRYDGYVFNSLEGARARALRIVTHYEDVAAQARKNVEGAPTVRKYAKAVTARRLVGESSVSPAATTLVDTVTATR